MVDIYRFCFHQFSDNLLLLRNVFYERYLVAEIVLYPKITDIVNLIWRAKSSISFIFCCFEYFFPLYLQRSRFDDVIVRSEDFITIGARLLDLFIDAGVFPLIKIEACLPASAALNIPSSSMGSFGANPRSQQK
ncbi:hypothetical protein ACI7RC_17250 [Brevibacillus sp. B_LB10_24]